MTESMVIIKSEPMIVTSESWGRVRWNWRFRRRQFGFDKHVEAEAERVLQQEVQITDYRDGARIGVRTEWRDVDCGPAALSEPEPKESK